MRESEALISEASRGSAPAVEELLQRHLPGLRAYVRLRAGPGVRARESVSDLVQSVCRDVLEHVGNFRYGGEAGFKNWLYTAALRRIQKKHDFHHAQRRDVGREARGGAGGGAGGGGGGDASAASAMPDLLAYQAALGTPSQAAIAREEMERIERAFDALSDEQRELIVQSRLVGMSHGEIAEAQGKNEGAVRVALHRALVRLAAVLDAQAGGGA